MAGPGISGKKNIAGKPPSQRQLRVGEVLRQRLSEVLHRFDFEPKVLKRATLTVTQVRVSPDLRHATAYVMPLGGQHADKIIHLLNEDVARLKKPVLDALHMKYVPDFRFQLDDSFDRAADMDALLATDSVSRDLAADDETPDADMPEKGA